jgi:hypothetical protein
MYLVFETESDIDNALNLLVSNYKYQIQDGRWITPMPNEIPEGLPPYTEEAENLSWYAEWHQAIFSLRAEISKKLEQKYDSIDQVYERVRRDFTNENILMGITEMGQTQLVLDAMEKVDYCMRSRSVVAVWDLIDAIPRSEPFLTEERLANFKTELYTKLVEVGVM